ncbi:MAG: hypothetical protein EOP86_21950 [Verrucomicrobiaceae bacterium]|nr:MAG: hypothetical protein EOP86_21950 [Verrucomicrobiaceae bacterium]
MEDSVDWSDALIDPELRRLLERMPVADFKGHGPLADVVGSSLPELKNADGALIPVRVADEGDAPVFLEFKAFMPAWHLLGLMALQTGTTVSLEDGALVFRRSEKPASLEDETTRAAQLANLRALLGLRAGDPQDDMTPQYTERIAQTLGSDIRLRARSETSAGISGSARDVKVLATALDAALSLPARITLSVAMMTVPPGVDFGVADGSSGTPPAAGAGNVLDEMESTVMAETFLGMTSPKLGGVLTSAHSGRMIQAALRHEGVRFKALLDQPAIPNQENLAAGGQPLTDGSQLEGKVSIFVKSTEDTADLDVSTITRTAFPRGLREDNLGINSQIMVWNGQTAVIGGFRQPDGSSVTFLVTAHSAGEESGGTDPSATDGELSAIPVPGKPGVVTSPYAEAPVELDVSSLKSGSTLTCPFTGRKFRIP